MIEARSNINQKPCDRVGTDAVGQGKEGTKIFGTRYALKQMCPFGLKAKGNGLTNF